MTKGIPQLESKIVYRRVGPDFENRKKFDRNFLPNFLETEINLSRPFLTPCPDFMG